MPLEPPDAPGGFLFFRTSSENICFGERRFHSFCHQPKQPSQGGSLLSLRASINDAEGEKQIPIADIPQERGQTLLVDSAARDELPPQRERLIVVLDRRQHVGIVAELGEKSPRQRSVTVRCRDRRISLRLTLKRVMGVNEHFESPVVHLR